MVILDQTKDSKKSSKQFKFTYSLST